MPNYREDTRPEHQHRWDKGIDCLMSGDGHGAIYIYTALANDGCATALTQIGRIYEFGVAGVDQDYGEAVTWFKHSVETIDDLESHLALARIYLQESSLDENHELARYHLQLLAQNEVMGGYFGLGLIYEFGLGVTKDSAEALKWYEKAELLGHVMARLHGANIRFHQKPLKNLFSLVMASIRVRCLKRRRPHDSRLAMWDDIDDSVFVPE